MNFIVLQLSEYCLKRELENTLLIVILQVVMRTEFHSVNISEMCDITYLAYENYIIL